MVNKIAKRFAGHTQFCLSLKILLVVVPGPYFRKIETKVFVRMQTTYVYNLLTRRSCKCVTNDRPLSEAKMAIVLCLSSAGKLLREEIELDLGCEKCHVVCILFAADSQHWFLFATSAIFPQPFRVLQGRNARME